MGRVRLVLAHETTHVRHLPYAAADITLLEGFATWASLRYWSGSQGIPSFDDAVRTYLAERRYVSVDNPPADCTADYERVDSKSLSALRDEWLAWLQAR